MKKKKQTTALAAVLLACAPLTSFTDVQAAPQAPEAVTTGRTHTGVCDQYRGLLSDAGLPVAYFIRIMWRESRCDPNQYNGRGRDRSYGLLQINTKVTRRIDLWSELQRRCGLVAREQLFDPATNIACAAKLYRAYGTRPWRTR